MPLYLNAKNTYEYYKYGTEPNVTVVGSPTIENGIASGFSSSNYLMQSSNFRPQTSTWEIGVDVITGADISNLQFIVGSGGAAYKIGIGLTGNHFLLALSNTNSSWNIANKLSGTYTVLPNTYYKLRVKYTGVNYSLDYSLNGIDWYEDIVVNNSAAIYDTALPLSFGANKHATGVNVPFLGSIDLTRTYIKINGEEWWRGTKGIESTADDYDYIVTVPPKEMSRIYFGSTEISKIYNGSTLVYDNTFKQPVLTANGTLGGDSFAVTGKSVYSGAYWNAFDNNASTIWHSNGGMPQWLTMYNPKALKLKKLTITTSNTSGHKGVTAGTVLGSNDNESWEHICDWTNDVTAQGATWEIAVNSQKYYKYHQLNITKTAYNPWLGACAVIAEIKMDAIK